MTYQEINQNLSIENLPNEIFKDIPEYEGLYQVSNLGRVKSLGNNKTRKERVSKIQKLRTGYLSIMLHKDNFIKVFTIHSLVMVVFKGKRPKGYDINHIDGNKEHNNINNLEYCTKSENQKHAIKIGLRTGDGLMFANVWEKNKIEITQYDKKGNYINKFQSIKEASMKTKIHAQSICQCRLKHRKSAGGFIWK